MIGKIIAGLMVKQIMLEAASDKNEETIKLVKKPGKKKSKELEINVRFECVPDRIPVYMVKLVDSAASATNVSFDEMIKHLKTSHELMCEISKEESTSTWRDKDEGQQDQQSDHDAGSRQQG